MIIQNSNPNENIDAIETRKREIDELMNSLQKESEELDTTLRVLKRFSGESNVKRQGSSKSGTPRPDGIPTIYKMAEMVLNAAEKDGAHGLTAREIVDRISVRYWPGVAGTQIQPSLYRLKKIGKLHKTKSGKFFLPKTNETPNDEQSESVSRVTGEVPASPIESENDPSKDILR